MVDFVLQLVQEDSSYISIVLGEYLQFLMSMRHHKRTCHQLSSWEGVPVSLSSPAFREDLWVGVSSQGRDPTTTRIFASVYQGCITLYMDTGQLRTAAMQVGENMTTPYCGHTWQPHKTATEIRALSSASQAAQVQVGQQKTSTYAGWQSATWYNSSKPALIWSWACPLLASLLPIYIAFVDIYHSI